MSPAIRRTFTVLLALAASAAVPAAASAPVGVSPGELDRVAPVESRCPTFSWTEAEGAVGYQLVAYALPDDPLAEVALSPETQVLGRRLPPRATSWTPAADLCFAPGGAYVWFLRAVLEERDGEVLDASEWSEGLHFGLPLAAEGDDAGADADADAGNRRRERPDASTRVGGAATATKSGRSVVTAPAAIRGDSVDATGEVHGVIGATASASGAGLAAANTAGGPDLILDGAAHGAADTRISEAGLDRSSATDQVFTIANSGAGAITLAVEGAITGQDGYGIISYWDPDLGALKVAHCTNATCSSSVISIVDEPSTGSAGQTSSVTIGADGLPLVVYTVDPPSGPDALKAAHCANAHCASATLSTIVSGTSPDSCAVTVGSHGLVLISYIESGFHVARCDNLLCTSATAVVVDASVGALGHYFGTSIRVGSDGRALASYYHDGSGNLKVAHCSDDLCSSATTIDANISGDVGKHSSVTIGADGLPLVAYCHEDSSSVLVTHCSNRFCVPKARM